MDETRHNTHRFDHVRRPHRHLKLEKRTGTRSFPSRSFAPDTQGAIYRKHPAGLTPTPPTESRNLLQPATASKVGPGVTEAQRSTAPERTQNGDAT